MELILPELTDLNTYINAERSNRYIAAGIKQRDTLIVYRECKAQGLPKMAKINKLTFIWKHKNKRKDKDNCAFSMKFIMDGLVKAGVIPDDSWDFVPDRVLHKHEIDAAHPGVVVIIK